jgi:hypothetical protein
LTTIAGLVAPVVMMIGTGRVAPFAVHLTGLGVATLWLGYVRGWKGLRWPAGILAALAVLLLTLRALARQPPEPPTAALVAQAFLLVAYLGSIAIRTLVRGRQVIVFEIVQTVLLLLVGLGGALAVSQATGAGVAALGAFVLALGLLAYAVAFQFVARRDRGALNFRFYSALALIFVIVGTATSFGGTSRAVALASVGLLLAAGWRQTARRSMGIHAVVALVVAAEASGLLHLMRAAFAGPVPTSDFELWPALVVLAVAAGTASCRMAECHEPWPALRSAAPLSIGGLTLGGMAGVAVLVAVAVAHALRSTSPTPEVIETVRTAVLSTLAVGAARVDRPGRWSAVGWFAYPLLGLIGLKLLLIDLSRSSAATLFLALACYGTALVLVPRVRAWSRVRGKGLVTGNP